MTGNATGPAPSTVALELMKQLIALSSGVLALSATFLDKFGELASWSIALLVVAWLGLIAAIIAALDTISSIVKSRIENDDDWSRGRGKTAARISKWSFICGIAIFALFAVTAGATSRRAEEQVQTIRIQGPIEVLPTPARTDSTDPMVVDSGPPN